VKQAQERTGTTSLSLNDLLATLTRFSAETIAEAVLRTVKKKKFEIYLSGGGAHNPLLAQWIRELLNIKKLRTTDELGVPGDAKEAILFALLANESLVGGNIDFGKRAKIPSVSMGKISFPA
jgi:anhydro-N-acetylmuramic acid kinase